MTEIASAQQLRMSFARWALVLVPLLVLLGGVSGVVSNAEMQSGLYTRLIKPELMPSALVYGVTWTVLYILLGLAVAMILDARGARGRGLALVIFALQLLLNLSWSPIFFTLYVIHFAVLLLGVILIAAAATTYLFSRIRGRAALLMLPYLLWLCYIGLFSFQTDQLNPNIAPLGKPAGSAIIQ